MEYAMSADLKMAIAPISAKELVTMDGIENNELFSQNVRFWLGKNTSVNKALEESIQDPDEHTYFPAFHNGLIVLTEALDVTEQTITISNYAVVNGCQSLRGLFENQKAISPSLRIMTKFI
jgi:hypothetical protein